MSARESRPGIPETANEATNPVSDPNATAASAGHYLLDDTTRGLSRLAYEAYALNDGTTEAAVLDTLEARGQLTDEDLYRAYLNEEHRMRSPQRVRSARAQLVKLGLVEAAGRGLSDAGNPSTIWQAVRV